MLPQNWVNVICKSKLLLMFEVFISSDASGKALKVGYGAKIC